MVKVILKVAKELWASYSSGYKKVHAYSAVTGEDSYRLVDGFGIFFSARYSALNLNMFDHYS